MLLNFISNFFFQNKGFHFYYCNYCGGCLNSMTEENIQAHLNDCSQHSSKFICRECGMVSENFLVAHALLFNSKLLFALFLQIHETPYPSFSSLSSKRDHKEMEQEDDEMMEETDKKIKNVRNTCINQVP